MQWTKIDPNNLPEGEVLATYEFDEYVVGRLKAKPSLARPGTLFAYCVLPYLNTDDGSYYEEPVTHCITIHDLHHGTIQSPE